MTFPDALSGVDRLVLATGSTLAMVQQSKALVDATVDTGVQSVVHPGIYRNGRMTEPHFAWHELVERYIEGSSIAWAQLHPSFLYGRQRTADGHR